MQLIKNKSYFVSATDTILRKEASEKSEPVNHLIFGDWLKYLGDNSGEWVKVHCRGDDGWLPMDSFMPERALEVNFIDVGQGDGCHIVTPDDQVILIDAGVGDNMFRFLNWRYNLRGRKVIGVDGINKTDKNARDPFKINHVIISHPDKDHYYGFQELFDSRKIIVENIYHSGIVERPITSTTKVPGLRYFSKDDLGGYVKKDNGNFYLWDLVSTDQSMHKLISSNSKTRKEYLRTLRKATENNPSVKFTTLNSEAKHVAGFDSGGKMELKVLGPLPEIIEHNNRRRNCLIKLGNEGVTKNGHSIILQLKIGQLKVMLGGDLNTESQDYLLKHYGNTTQDTSYLENRIRELFAKGPHASSNEKMELHEIEAELNRITTFGRRHFQVDISKACHHGSSHFSRTFLQALNSIVTVISSGDEESYAHPRPDALGSFGKYGRGFRPLIFSTELARSTKEFTHIYKYMNQLMEYEEKLGKAKTKKEKEKLEKDLHEKKDSNVAKYGMITLRTDGQKVVLAQKLEIPGGNGKKWDIHELHFNNELNEFEYK